MCLLPRNDAITVNASLLKRVYVLSLQQLVLLSLAFTVIRSVCFGPDCGSRVVRSSSVFHGPDLKENGLDGHGSWGLVFSSDSIR